MKNAFVALLVFAGALLTHANSAHAQGGGLLAGGGPAAAPGVFQIKELKIANPKTPEFQTLGGETQSKRYQLGVWLEVEVEFSTTAPTAEVAFHYEFAINGKLLVGDQTLEDVPAGQSLFTSVYVAPRTLATLMKGQPVTVNTLQDCRVSIQRPGVARALAEKSLKGGNPNWFASQPQITGFVLNKAQTPFANLWWDRYETVKPPTR